MQEPQGEDINMGNNQTINSCEKKKYIFRLLSNESACAFQKKASFIYKHPYTWNIYSAKSWKNTEKEVIKSKYPGISVAEPIKAFSWRGLVYPLAKKIGLYDSCEGLIYTPKGITTDNEGIQIDVKGFIDERILTLCFSYVECQEKEIEEKIIKRIEKTNGYGAELKYYIYAELTENLFANMSHDFAVNIGGRIGSAIVPAMYFDQSGRVEVNNFPNTNIFDPMFGKPGYMLTYLPHIVINTEEFSEDDLRKFFKTIKESVPLKYYPTYGEELEVRLLIYIFDDDQITEEKEVFLDEETIFIINKVT